MLPLVLCLFASSPSPLASAQAHLAAEKLDDVLFDLDGKALADADKAPASELLARAGQVALRKDDAVMALQFAQMALRLKADQALALEVGARAARAEKQYTPAEDYSERWIAASQGGSRAHLLRAEIATDQGEWQHGMDLAAQVKEKELGSDERARLELVRTTCKKELAERHLNITEVKSLEAKLTAAAERVKRMPDRANQLQPTPASTSQRVVLYGTSWCSYCAKARRYLLAKHVVFTDRDIERDASAAEELAMKLTNAHQSADGVPIIDVHGTLVHGFDREELERLLR